MAGATLPIALGYHDVVAQCCDSMELPLGPERDNVWHLDGDVPPKLTIVANVVSA